MALMLTYFQSSNQPKYVNLNMLNFLKEVLDF